jgi:hypothetical protein
MLPVGVTAAAHVGVTAWRARTCGTEMRARNALVALLLAALLLGGGDGAASGGFAPAATFALLAAHYALDALGALGGDSLSRLAKFGQLVRAPSLRIVPRTTRALRGRATRLAALAERRPARRAR